MDSSLLLSSSVFESLSDSPPMHCRINIESFSLLSKFLGYFDDPKDAYESEKFEAGGYKWKLVIYPEGNKKKMVEDHISVYLQIVGVDQSKMDWEVYVDFRLFLLDQNKNVYKVFEDAYTRTICIQGSKFGVGFDKLVSLDEFNDPSHGYLVHDNCVFGAEVYVCKEIRRGGVRECVSSLISPTSYMHVWTLKKFSKLTDRSYISDPFVVGGHKWYIQLFPKGDDHQNQNMAAFLMLDEAIPPVTKIFAELYICILHPSCDIKRDKKGPVKWCYTNDQYGHGWDFDKLDRTCRGLDTLKIETKLTIYGTTKRPNDLKKQNNSTKTKEYNIVPNKVDARSKGSTVYFVLASMLISFLFNCKNKYL